MSIEFKNRIYGALNLNNTERETADLIDWPRLRAAPDLGVYAARYIHQIGVIQISQKHVDELFAAGKERQILALLLHERAHQAIGAALGGDEAHNALFAGIAWGLQSRAGTWSADQDYDIQDEPHALDRAQRIERAIASADSTADARKLIDNYINNRRQDNKTQALGQIPRVFAIAIGIPAAIALIINPRLFSIFF